MIIIFEILPNFIDDQIVNENIIYLTYLVLKWILYVKYICYD